MNLDDIIVRMASNAQAIQALVQGVSDKQARWKPGPDDWSILEVINHLYDEELEDFRVHLDLILHHPDEPWPGIDPQGWVTARHYNERSLGQSLHNLVRARQESLAWLKGLVSPDWQAVYRAPFAEMTAGDMLASWAAHDLLHMRQLVELHWAYMTRPVQPYQVRYAGVW
jgi:DinB superfamily